MKATGIVRKIDDLGRVVVPRELCKTYGIMPGETAMEYFTDGDFVVMRKYEPGCVFCGSQNNLTEFCGKQVCRHCRDDMTKMIQK